jgi:hypothetical protein
LQNKSFHIDANIIANKNKNNRNTNKKSNTKKSKNNFFIKFSFIVILILIVLFFFIKDINDALIKDFYNGKTVVCKDRLVSKEFGYIFNKNKNAFVNRRDGLIFTTYFCSNFDE